MWELRISQTSRVDFDTKLLFLLLVRIPQKSLSVNIIKLVSSNSERLIVASIIKAAQSLQ